MVLVIFSQYYLIVFFVFVPAFCGISTPLPIIIQREFPQADKIKTIRSEDRFFK
jgi:hypothetical protein